MACRLSIYVSGDGGRVVIRLHTDPENRGTGAYQLLIPYTHGVPHVDCDGPSICSGRSEQGSRGEAH
jgi:hypothetical protein